MTKEVLQVLLHETEEHGFLRTTRDVGRLKDKPLMILALARPSVDEAHPRLWEEHRAARFVLEPLLRKAAEKLARAVLGEHTRSTSGAVRAS